LLAFSLGPSALRPSFRPSTSRARTSWTTRRRGDLVDRVVRAQPCERLSISVAGRGCAMLVVMNQVGQ